MSNAKANMELTASVIDEMAEQLEEKASELRRLSADLRRTSDLEHAGEAAQVVATLTKSMRLDLLVLHTAQAVKDLSITE